MPWPRRSRDVRCDTAARKTSGAEESLYSSRKWCSTTQVVCTPMRSASSHCSTALASTVASASSSHGRGSWCSKNRPILMARSLHPGKSVPGTGQYVAGFVREYAGTDKATKEDPPMAKVKPIPDNYPRVTVYLAIDGASDAIQVDKKIFGAEERMRMPGPDGRVGHAEIAIGASVIMMSAAFLDNGHFQ